MSIAEKTRKKNLRQPGRGKSGLWIAGACFLLLVGLRKTGLAAPAGEAKRKDDQAVSMMEIERGRWSTEDSTFPHRKNFRLLCVEGLQFFSVEGYGGGQSSSTAVNIIQVMGKDGKPKTCK